MCIDLIALPCSRITFGVRVCVLCIVWIRLSFRPNDRRPHNSSLLKNVSLLFPHYSMRNSAFVCLCVSWFQLMISRCDVLSGASYYLRSIATRTQQQSRQFFLFSHQQSPYKNRANKTNVTIFYHICFMCLSLLCNHFRWQRGKERERKRVRKTFDYWWCVICHCVRPNNFPRK